VDLTAQQRQKQHMVVAESELEADEDSECAADGGYFSCTPSPSPPHTPCFDCDLRRQEGVRG
jgi:hypothetical protein